MCAMPGKPSQTAGLEAPSVRAGRLTELTRGYTAAVLDDMTIEHLGADASAGSVEALRARISQVVAEVEVFSSAMASSAELWRVMCQGGYPVEVRIGILDDLLGDRTQPETRRLISFAVRYEHASELASVFSGLVDVLTTASSRVGSREGGPAEAPASRSASRERLGGYAAGLFDSLEDRSALEDLEDQLFRFARIVESSPELRRLMTDRDSPRAIRLGVVDDLLAGRASAVMSRMVAYVITAGRARDLVGSLDWLAERVARERGRRLARVSSAVPMEQGQSRELARALSAKIGAPVELQMEVDRRLVGGAVALVGDIVVDGSVRRRLDQLAGSLKSGGGLGVLSARVVTGEGDADRVGRAGESTTDHREKPGDEGAVPK